MGLLNKNELKYILYAMVFAVLWFVVLVPLVLKYLTDISPILQFLLFNLGLLTFLTVYLKYASLDKKIPFGNILKNYFLIMGLDIMIPPLMVGLNGVLLEGPLLSFSSTDYFVGWVYTSIGLPSFLIFFMTYVITPLVFFLISALIDRNFVKNI